MGNARGGEARFQRRVNRFKKEQEELGQGMKNFVPSSKKMKFAPKGKIRKLSFIN